MISCSNYNKEFIECAIYIYYWILRPGSLFKFWLCHLLDEWLGASHWRFQCFEFLVSKMRIVKVLGLSKWCSGKEYTCQCRRCWRRKFNPWIRKIPSWRKWQPAPFFLPGRSYGQSASLQSMGSQRVGHNLSTHNKSTYQGSLRELICVKLLKLLSLKKTFTRESCGCY